MGCGSSFTSSKQQTSVLPAKNDISLKRTGELDQSSGRPAHCPSCLQRLPLTSARAPDNNRCQLTLESFPSLIRIPFKKGEQGVSVLIQSLQQQIKVLTTKIAQLSSEGRSPRKIFQTVNHTLSKYRGSPFMERQISLMKQSPIFDDQSSNSSSDSEKSISTRQVLKSTNDHS